MPPLPTLSYVPPVELDEKSRGDVINYLRWPAFYAQTLPGGQ